MKCPHCEDEIKSLKMQEVMATEIEDINERLFGIAWLCPNCQKIISVTPKPDAQE